MKRKTFTGFFRRVVLLVSISTYTNTSLRNLPWHYFPSEDILKFCDLKYLFFFLAVTGCTAPMTETKTAAVAGYLSKAEKAEITDEKLYFYRKALDTDPDNLDALVGRGKAYLGKSLSNSRNDLSWRSPAWFKQSAMKDFNRALELSPNSAAAFYARGGAYQYQGMSKEALSDFSRAIELDPTNVSYYIARSYAYREKNDDSLKLADIDKALALDQNSVGGHLAKASFFSGQKEYQSALAEYNRAIALKPQNTGVYIARGDFYQSQGKIPEAVSDYGRAIELAPTQSWLYERRASLERKLGQKEAAEADEKKAIEVEPQAQLLLGIMKEGDAAIKAASNAIEANPWDFSYYLLRGRAYGRIGDYQKALADMDRAVELGEDMPEPYRFRAMIYGEIGRYDEAVADLKTACMLPEGKCKEYQKAVQSMKPFRGQVLDKESHEPVPYTYIVIKRTSTVRNGWNGNTSHHRDDGIQYGISDSQGHFEVPPVSKRPVLPDLMGGETETRVVGAYHPEYSSYCDASLTDPDKVVMELREYSRSNYYGLESYLPRETIELRRENFPEAIAMLKIWRELVGEQAQREIDGKIKELQSHLNDTSGSYRAFLRAPDTENN
jgi:tetratricopeptide (TPR) repeat protein